MYYELFDHYASTSRTHFVNFAAYTASVTLKAWISLRGHLRSLIFAPIESAYMASYWSSVVTLVLSCRDLEILRLLYAESRFFDTPPPPFPFKISGSSPWSRSVMLEWNYFGRLPSSSSSPFTTPTEDPLGKFIDSTPLNYSRPIPWVITNCPTKRHCTVSAVIVSYILFRRMSLWSIS